MMMFLSAKTKKGDETKILSFLPNEKDFSHKTPGRDQIHVS